VFVATPLGMFAGIVFTTLLAMAAIGDVRTRRIPNPLVGILALLGICYSVVTMPFLAGLIRSAEGLGIGLACWLPLYLFGWLGAGDVKLFAAAGAWLGPAKALEGSLIAALLGAVLALIWMLRSSGIRNVVQTLGIATTLPSVLTQPTNPPNTVRSLPYGVAIAAGAICAAWIAGLIVWVMPATPIGTDFIKG
jgi:prepilin peptidase CpaA